MSTIYNSLYHAKDAADQHMLSFTKYGVIIYMDNR